MTYSSPDWNIGRNDRYNSRRSANIFIRVLGWGAHLKEPLTKFKEKFSWWNLWNDFLEDLLINYIDSNLTHTSLRPIPLVDRLYFCAKFSILCTLSSSPPYRLRSWPSVGNVNLYLRNRKSIIAFKTREFTE